MIILTSLLKKVFVFAFILAVLFLIREGIRFFRGLNTGEYEITTRKLLWVGVSVALVLTLLITGFVI